MTSYPIIRGMAAMLLSVFLYSINDALLKWLAGTYHPMQIIFCRSFFTFLPLVGYARHTSSLKGYKLEKIGPQALRAIIAALSVPLYIYSYWALPLADAYAVSYVAPLLMAIFAIPILGEKVSPHAWIAITIGFLGVLVMMRPGSAVLSLGGLSAFMGGTLFALSLVLSRKLSQTESIVSITAWFMSACFIMSSLFMPFYWVEPTLSDWGLFAILGIVGCGALVTITQAFKLAPASIVGPIDYLLLVFGAIIGYFIWGDIPDAYIIAGACILVGSGLYLLYQETREKSMVLLPVVEE